MISADDARQTVELADRYVIEPSFVEYTRKAFGPEKGAKPWPRTSPTPATATTSG
jgi:UDP-N-acetylglucosamine 4,6-dehydratase